MNGLSVVLEIANQHGNGNVVTAPAEGNGNGINDNPIRCYNCLGEGHYASNYAYVETKRVKVKCTSKDTLQQASTSGTQSDNAVVYDSNGSIETNALSKPVTSNSVPSTRESKVVQTVNVISPRIFRTNPYKTSRVDNVVPKKPVKTSVRIKPITVSQPNVIHKQQANSDLNGFSSTRVNNTAKTKRPRPISNSYTDRVPSKSKSSCLSNNVEKIKENHRNSQIPKNQKHMSSEFTANHGVYVLNYVNDMNSHADNQSANVLKSENQKKHKANAKKSKELGSKGSLASSRPSKPRTCLRINPSKTSKEEKHMPNIVSASARTKPITVSQPHVIAKKDVNSDLNGLSSTGVDNTKTRRPQPRSNKKMIGSPLRLRVVEARIKKLK
nr:hypothetical protein [Tanacetum cinerariifolium]